MESTKFLIEKDETNSKKDKSIWRANINTLEEVEDWLKEFKAASQTDWIVKNEPKGLQK